jgi:hypothetical protein
MAIIYIFPELGIYFYFCFNMEEREREPLVCLMPTGLPGIKQNTFFIAKVIKQIGRRRPFWGICGLNPVLLSTFAQFCKLTTHQTAN